MVGGSCNPTFSLNQVATKVEEHVGSVVMRALVPKVHPAEIVMVWTGHILLKALHIRQKRKLHHTRLWYKTC